MSERDNDLHCVDDGRGLRSVFVDGVEVEDCLQCHTGEGWAKICKKDDEGRFLMNAAGDDVETEILHGRVAVKFLEGEDQ